jgi:DNA-binding LacI/PurR family transcriptional regulator
MCLTIYPVIGFDDIPAATLVTPNLTTIRQPLRAIGEVATQRLIERMNSSSNAGPSYSLLQPELIVRGSTAIAPRKKRSSRVDNSLPQENKGESHE